MSAVVLALPLQLGACSTFWFWDDELEPQRIEIQSVREEDPDVPNLATVPDQPPLPSPSTQRSGIIEGLSADRENARYTDEVLTPQAVAVPPATPPEPAYPPPPTVQATRTQVAESSPVSSSVPPPPDIGVLQDGDEPLAPPPPALPAAPAVAPAAPQPDSTISSVAAPGATSSPAVPSPPPAASSTAPAGANENGLLYQPPTGLLQQQAFQQEALQQQQMQQLAFNRQAFEQQARLEAIQQQQLRERVIQQQAAQWKYPALRQPQIPAVAPANGPGVAAPAFAQSFATPAPAALAGPQSAYSPSAPVGLATQSVPGQLVGLIYFGHGSAHLSGRDMQILQQVAALQRYQSRGLRIVGHSSARTGFVDQQRHETANRTMSLRRANVVASELVRLGADQNRIRIDGLGAAQPVYHEFMATGEAGNRRVEIFLE